MTQEEKRAKWRANYRKYHPSKDRKVFFHPAYGRIVEHDGYATRIFWNEQMLSYLKKNYANTLNSELAEWLGVSQRTVIRKARELGLQKDPEWIAHTYEERRRLAQAATKVRGNAGQIKPGQHLSPETEYKKGHKPTNKKLGL